MKKSTTSKASKTHNRTKAAEENLTLTGICFFPSPNTNFHATAQHNVKFVFKQDNDEVVVSPTDMELFDMLLREGSVEQHQTSQRTDSPREVVVTGFSFDPICEQPVRFDFSDASERPLRWPILTAELWLDTLSQLIGIYHKNTIA
jgi:hypothetical protein